MPSSFSHFPICAFLFLKCLLSSAAAQQISTNTPVPPLQWLNITTLLSGPSAPPLKDASIGYDDTTRSVIIFGGQSSSGIPTSQTFLLNLETMLWSTPTPQADLPQGEPPARYMAVSGEDFSSSYRQGHLVIGGQGANSKALDDAWEFDFINQFWSEVSISPGGTPPPRWGASGGRDIRSQFNAASTNNTFYMAGGTDGTNMYNLSDVWEFQITGTLSSNLASDLYGSWTSQTVGNAPGKVDQAATVVYTSVVSVGGCDTPNDSNESCAEPDSYVVNPGDNSEISPPACPAPRFGGTVVPNLSTFSGNYPTQVFLFLGTFNSTYWNDQGGSQKGEVDVLDIQTGAWSRILPAGDPGTIGTPAYPSPREGAAAISYTQALVGTTRSFASDTLVFGGRDESGNYLNEVWILRAYNDSITQTNGSWGAPGGQLQTGVNANGAGVTNQYMTQCAVQLLQPTTSGSGTPGPTSTTPPGPQSFQAYDVSFAHKLLAPLSIALLLPAVLLFRMALPSAQVNRPADRNIALFYLSAVIAVMAYGTGLGGLISSFTSLSTSSTLSKRATSGVVLRTGHGDAGLALVITLYAIVPFTYLLSMCCCSTRGKNHVPENSECTTYRANSTDTAEKLAAFSTTQSLYPPASPSSPRARLHSWGGSSLLWPGRRSREGRVSTDSESVSSAGPQRAFEVVNRPARTRRASTNGLSNTDAYQRVPVAPRSLGDVDWMDRRRSLNAVNELDFAANQAQRTNGGVSTPVATDMLSTRALMPTPTFIAPKYEMPSTFDLCLRILFHALILALCILSLIALWYRAPKALFAVFLIWTLLFYCILFALAWHGRPRKSALTSIIARLRAEPPQPTASPGTPTSRPLSMTGTDQYPFPTENRGPYLHQPPYRQAGHDDLSTSQGGPRSVETDDDDDDEDEDTRQRRIEEEMGRREVSIVTVPKRRLWITNPS